MILLDTNVVSALMRLNLEPAVEAWLRTVSRDQLFVSTPTMFELRYRIENSPPGKRRRALETAYKHIISVALENRILALDTEAAEAAGHIHASQRKRGRNTSVPDSQIAGIALNRRLHLATRDFDDFSDLGIELVNPWGLVR